MAFMVHIITGPIGHLSDFLELLPLDYTQMVRNFTGLLQNWRKAEMFNSMEIQQGKSK